MVFDPACSSSVTTTNVFTETPGYHPATECNWVEAVVQWSVHYGMEPRKTGGLRWATLIRQQQNQSVRGKVASPINCSLVDSMGKAWEDRNQALHGKTATEKSEAIRQEARQHLEIIYQNRHLLEPRSAQN
jgi:hypothetical protein